MGKCGRMSDKCSLRVCVHCCLDIVAHLVIAIAARFAMMCPAQQFGRVGAKLYDGNSFLMLDLSHTSMLGV